jgi:hypothetical protein
VKDRIAAGDQQSNAARGLRVGIHINNEIKEESWD